MQDATTTPQPAASVAEAAPPAGEAAQPAPVTPPTTAQAQPAPEAQPVAAEAQPVSEAQPVTAVAEPAAPAQPVAAAAAPVAPAPLQPATDATQVAQVVTREFASYDRDASGGLDKTEFGTWMAALRKAAQPEFQAESAEATAWVGQAFTQADTDKNASINQSELTTFLTPRPA